MKNKVQLKKPILHEGKYIYFYKQVNCEIPHYYIYDQFKRQIGGAIVGIVNIKNN
jgi:predicted SprT family Zn-dependent metalloprotease